MSRPRMFLRKVTISMSPLELAKVDFLASRNQMDRSDIVRRFVRAVLDSDQDFDFEGFGRFVAKVIEEETDPEYRAILQEQVQEAQAKRRK